MKNSDKDITRKTPLKNGKIRRLTAAGTFLILNPKKAQAFSGNQKILQRVCLVIKQQSLIYKHSKPHLYDAAFF